MAAACGCGFSEGFDMVSVHDTIRGAGGALLSDGASLVQPERSKGSIGAKERRRDVVSRSSEVTAAAM